MKTTKTIGTVTTYHGTEFRYLRGQKVRIVGVFKNAAGPDHDPDEDAYITDDDSLLRFGAVTANDRVEVQPWLEKEGRFSFASSDPKATDLAVFAGLM